MAEIESKFTIRDGTLCDIPSLCELINFLGYETSIEEMTERFNCIISNPDYRTLVAEAEGKIVGMAGLTKNYSYERNGKYIRIIALVTHPDKRNIGVGSSLLDYVENWLREINVNYIILNCGNRDERKNAHDFYFNRGYLVRSTGYFKKIY